MASIIYQVEELDILNEIAEIVSEFALEEEFSKVYILHTGLPTRMRLQRRLYGLIFTIFYHWFRLFVNFFIFPHFM